MNTQTCADCGKKDGHKDQVTQYPEGSLVESMVDIAGAFDKIVTKGTRGKITGHCHDGRAFVRFPEGGSHTFHHPEGYIQPVKPEGYRPLLLCEISSRHEEGCPNEGWPESSASSPAEAETVRCRTRRPLPEPPAKLPLGPEDVPPGSAIRPKNEDKDRWHFVTCVSEEAVFYPLTSGVKAITYRELMDHGSEIHRPGNLDANGKPVWEPCHKTA